MNTKLKGDLAEQAAILAGLKRGWGVLKPVGDRLPYDLVFDLVGVLVKIQVKCAWKDEASGNYVIDNRRTKTNRRNMIRQAYDPKDFDFALAYIEEFNLFYIFPVNVFIGYGSEIHLVETDKRQRKPRSSVYRDAWYLILQWAVPEAIQVRSPVKVGEAVNGVIPSQVPAIFEIAGKGVET